MTSLDIHERLNPRDAFFLGGGGTNAVKLYKNVEDDETIHYLDFFLCIRQSMSTVNILQNIPHHN